VLIFCNIVVAEGESKPKLSVKAAATCRQVTSPSDATYTSMSEDASELGVQLTVGRRLKHIAMKATFDQPRSRDGQVEVVRGCGTPSEFYASELLGSFIVERQQQQQPTATVLQAVGLPLSTLIVVESPFNHTVHYINADLQPPRDISEHGSPSSASNSSSESSSSSSTSSDSFFSSSSLQVPVPHSAGVQTDVTDGSRHLNSDDAAAAADLADLDELREVDLLPLPLCSESPPWHLGITDDELRLLLTTDPDSSSPPDTTSALDVGDLTSATELSWPSPSAADTSPPLGQASKSSFHDYSTPEVIELLGSVYDDWLRDDPDFRSFFSPT